ncbi:putative immunity protein [Longimycelium tulufanense]|uniref:putative immunity protein n=1 Tax=Longimycelium tulufanense TaxID=907463 RepID=UPI0035716CCB
MAGHPDGGWRGVVERRQRRGGVVLRPGSPPARLIPRAPWVSRAWRCGPDWWCRACSGRYEGPAGEGVWESVSARRAVWVVFPRNRRQARAAGAESGVDGARLGKQDHGSSVLWAADCAEHVLPYFEKRHPEDDRPRQAVAVGRAWVRGEIAMSQARTAAFAAHAAARDADQAVARAVARAAGHAAATAHRCRSLPARGPLRCRRRRLRRQSRGRRGPHRDGTGLAVLRTPEAPSANGVSWLRQ